jgi:hypothetical protein
VNRFWPIREAAQADYERLREQVLAGICQSGPAAVRFERFGMAGLITRPCAEPIWIATMLGAVRPRWSPHVDPRVEALADGYQLLFACLRGPGRERVEAHR